MYFCGPKTVFLENRSALICWFFTLSLDLLWHGFLPTHAKELMIDESLKSLDDKSLQFRLFLL